MKMQGSLFIILSLLSLNAFAYTMGIDGKAKGDVIAVRTDDQIINWCDFTKQIYRSTSVFCVFNGKSQALEQ